MPKIKKFIIILVILLINPTFVKAYSDYIIAGGKSLGIELNIDGIIIAGTYKVNGVDIAQKSGIKPGDKIISINNKKVATTDEMISLIKSYAPKLNITYERNKQTYHTTLELVIDNDSYKSGLYIKDSIIGIGTLSYIDPNTKIFGALGHEITDKNTKQIIDITGGKIFETQITSITKSIDGSPGEKNARYNKSIINGNIEENTKHGIFGTIDNINTSKLYKVAAPKLGKASILTVLKDDVVSAYDVNIIRLDKNNTTKNIIFEITDQNLLNITGGIVQGMSGSPIIQGNEIVGAVTHVVVDNPKKGYGIFITNMLIEGEN